MVVPGYGFLLNNELTDFNLDHQHDPADPGGVSAEPTTSRAASARARRSRRRSCCATAGRSSPLGSPGGATIITTVAADPA